MNEPFGYPRNFLLAHVMKHSGRTRIHPITLLPIIRTLSNSEEVQRFDMRKAARAREDSIAPLEHDKTYHLWTPYGTFGAARVLRDAGSP